MEHNITGTSVTYLEKEKCWNCTDFVFMGYFRKIFSFKLQNEKKQESDLQCDLKRVI